LTDLPFTPERVLTAMLAAGAEKADPARAAD